MRTNEVKIVFVLVLVMQGHTMPYVDSLGYETHQQCLLAVPEAIQVLMEELQLKPDERTKIDVGCKKVYVDKLGWEG